ncbi:MAG: serine hydrolase domain-containing protein [Terricaulis sp.]
MSNLLGRRRMLRDGAALFALAATGACATPSAGADFDWARASPLIDDNGRTRIHEAIAAPIQEKLILGAVTSIARPDALLWYEADGAKDFPALTPMPRDAIFNMMSSTKVVTSVAVLQLMEQGKLSLDDRVSRFIPSFANPRVAIAPEGWQQAAADPALRPAIAAQVRVVPAQREITIKDLLTHTAGLSAAYGLGAGPGSLVNTSVPGSRQTTLAERIPKLGALALDFQPGSRFGYSPLDGMDTLLRVVEIASGQDADAYLRQHLFEPLQMGDTYFSVPVEKQARVLKLYGVDNGVFSEQEPLLGTGPTTYFSGGAGLLSTVHDFTNLHLMLLNRGSFKTQRLLRAETVELMTTNHVGTMYADWVPMLSRGMGFGLGVGIVVDEATTVTGRGRGAFGWGGGYGTEAWVETELNLVACHFVQNGSPRPPGPAPAFARALRQVLRA